MIAGRVGIFGGTFDPMHIGHLAAVQDAISDLSLDRVLFVPNRLSPHKLSWNVSSVEDRVAMVERSIAGNPRFELSRIELERAGPSYTLDTMRALRDLMPDNLLFFLVGCDALGALHRWRCAEKLLEEFQVVVMDRPTGKSVDWSEVETHFPAIRRQVQVVHVAQLEISGEDIRRRVAEGRPVRYLVAPGVEEYIEEHGLYQRV